MSTVANQLPWILMGDFNVTRYITEHNSGCSFVTEDMKQLNDCVNKIEMDDLGSSGIMCNEAFLARYPQASATFLPYLVSDHSPILVIPNGVQRKKRAFRFMNHLAGKDEFLNIVAQVWDTQIRSHMMFQVVSKLKLLKKKLNKLNWANGNVFTKVKVLRDKLKQSQVAIDLDPHNISLRNTATNTLLEYEAANQDELILLQQKVKIQWPSEGDKNTKFFHSVLKSRVQKSKVDNICDANEV
ncbi:uncharacterized protein [Rutidosis leptorrhynchoides]|uniref:uncharacterized protein n=1 Tax=Rutidosis leptorrhynchoides TaxID=125765 RepID=UPI003A9A108B